MRTDIEKVDRASDRAGEELLIVDDVARVLGLSPRTVRRLIAEQKITHFRMGRSIRLRGRDIDEFLLRSVVKAVS